MLEEVQGEESKKEPLCWRKQWKVEVRDRRGRDLGRKTRKRASCKQSKEVGQSEEVGQSKEVGQTKEVRK